MPLPIIPIVLLTALSTGATTGVTYAGYKSIKPPAVSSTYNQPFGKNVTPKKFIGPKRPAKPLTRTGKKPFRR